MQRKLEKGNRIWAVYANRTWGYIDILKTDQQFAYSQNSKFMLLVVDGNVICISNPEKSTITYIG